MAARAVLGEGDFTALERRFITAQKLLAAGRVLQQIRSCRLEKEQSDIRSLLLGGVPIARILIGIGDLDRRHFLATGQGVEMKQPFLTEQSDVDIDPIQSAQDADRVGAVFQNMRRPNSVRLFVILRQHGGLLIVLELFIVDTAAGELLLAPSLGDLEPGADVIDRVHRARIVDVIGRHERSIEGSRQRGVNQLVDEIRRIFFPEQHAVDPKILRAGIGVDVFPLGILRILRRFYRARPDMAKAARHADPVGAHQTLIVVIIRVGVKSFRIPFLCRRFVESRIGKQAQTEDSGGIAVIRTDRQILAARADFHAGILLLIFKRVGGTILASDIEPQAKTVGVGPLGLFEARFVHYTEILPAFVTGQMRRLWM